MKPTTEPKAPRASVTKNTRKQAAKKPKVHPHPEPKPKPKPVQQPAQATKPPAHQQAVAHTAPPVCPPPAEALAGVYHPSRLRVLDACQKASGTVVDVRHEEDEDLHINVAPDPAYKGLLISGNYSGEDGSLVVEFMARDGGRLLPPTVGDHLDLVGAYVNDLQHDWAEIHPVWSVSINGGQVYTSGPRYGGSPEEARSYNAEGECQNQNGTVCRGYGSGSYSENSSSAQGADASGSLPASTPPQPLPSGNGSLPVKDYSGPARTGVTVVCPREGRSPMLAVVRLRKAPSGVGRV